MSDRLPRPRTYRRRWNLHCCLFSLDCMRWKSPPRITICTPWRAGGIALTPSARWRVKNGKRKWWLTWR